jgi:CRISPR-associated endonuclease Cas1
MENIIRQTIVPSSTSAREGRLNFNLKHYGLKRIDYSIVENVKRSYDEALVKFNNENKHLVDHKFKSQLRYYEGSASMHYFREIFNLFPESFRPEKRKGFKAYDGLNNIFNLGYRILSNKVMVALFKARLEPYLGFYHTIKFGQPSLVCDFMDLYRYVIDHFLITYCRKLDDSDFVWKDDIHAGRKGKRVITIFLLCL